MAIDLGEKRIGIALSDPTRMLASAHSVIKRSSRKADFAQYQQIIAANDVTLIVMGLPLTLDGGDSATTRWVRDYAAHLAAEITVPLQLWDETYTTKQAHASMQARGMTTAANGATVSMPSRLHSFCKITSTACRRQHKPHRHVTPLCRVVIKTHTAKASLSPGHCPAVHVP